MTSSGSGRSRTSTTLTTKIKTNDRLSALQMIMRHLGGFDKDSMRVDLVGRIELLRRARKRSTRRS